MVNIFELEPPQKFYFVYALPLEMSVNVFRNQILLDVWNPKYTELYSLLTRNIAKTAKLYETQLIVSIKYILY